jgi:hypothetical protein
VLQNSAIALTSRKRMEWTLLDAGSGHTWNAQGKAVMGGVARALCTSVSDQMGAEGA